MTLSEYPRPVAPPGWLKPTAATFLATAALAISAVAAFPSVGAVLGASQGTLLVQASDAHGDVQDVEVFVDGTSRCTMTPCVVDAVSEGVHWVRVIANEYEPLPAVEARVVDGHQSLVQVELTPSKARQESQTEKAPTGELVHISELDAVESEPKPNREAAAPTTRRAAASPVPAFGTLSLVSNPPANVIVDGKPIGMSPKTMRVGAGTHTVVFAHPDGRRKTVTAVVAPGRTRSVGARL